MAAALAALVRFYRTGEAADREAYDIAWVSDRESPVDTINGFIEVYVDARGMKGAWEGLVFYVNHDKTEAIRTLAREAQWFEDRMPWDPAYRKEGVHGVTGNAVEVIVETGHAGPMTPVGINLPNDQHVRERYGSKSVSLANVTEAYERGDAARLPPGVLVDRRGSRARREVGRVRRRAVHQHARGDRPRFREDRAAPRRQPAGVSARALLGARGDAGGPGRALLHRRSRR